MNAEPAKIELESAITASSVLQNRAVITRQGKVRIWPGDSRIALRRLPLNILENSVRVNGQGPEGTRIIGVELKREFIAEVKDEKLRELENNLHALQADDTALANELEELNATLAMARELTKTVSGEMGKGYSWKKLEMSDVDRAVKFAIDQMHSTNGQLRAKNIERRKLAQKIAVVQGELNRLGSLGDKELNTITVDVEAANEGEFELTVEYAIDGASWYPIYDARVLTEEQKVDFTYYGMVNQQTGENWKNTLITLSTAPDSPSTQLPELSPWYLYAYAPVAKRPMMSRKMAKGDMMAQTATLAPMAPPPCEAIADEEICDAPKVAAVAQVARVETSGEAVVYRIEKPADIPSEEETPKKLTVGMFPLNTEIRYLTIPKVISEVYTKAKVTNSSEFMLLPGEVNLFADSEYIGQTQMGNVAPNEKFEFSLGTTRAVKSKRELVKREVASGGMISKDKRISYAFRIKVENNKKTDIRITVKDHLPYPQHEKIKLEEVRYGEGDEPTKRTDLNILEWTFLLPSGKKKIIDYEFTLVYPAEMTIEGET